MNYTENINNKFELQKLSEEFHSLEEWLKGQRYKIDLEEIICLHCGETTKLESLCSRCHKKLLKSRQLKNRLMPAIIFSLAALLAGLYLSFPFIYP